MSKSGGGALILFLCAVCGMGWTIVAEREIEEIAARKYRMDLNKMKTQFAREVNQQSRERLNEWVTRWGSTVEPSQLIHAAGDDPPTPARVAASWENPLSRTSVESLAVSTPSMGSPMSPAIRSGLSNPRPATTPNNNQDHSLSSQKRLFGSGEGGIPLSPSPVVDGEKQKQEYVMSPFSSWLLCACFLFRHYVLLMQNSLPSVGLQCACAWRPPPEKK